MTMDTMKKAQLAHDHQLPEDLPTAHDWLGTVDGDNWVYDATENLVKGDDLKIAGRTVLGTDKLDDALQAHLIERLEQDDDKRLAQLVLAAINGDASLARANAVALLGKPTRHSFSEYTIAHEIAEDLVRPFAELRLQELRDEANEPEDE